MLVFLPALIFLTAAISGTILVITRRGGGFIWAIGFITALTIWILSLVVPVSSYPVVSGTNWLPFSQVFAGFTFKIDLYSIALIFCISSIALSYVITSTVHLQSADWRRSILLVFLNCSFAILTLVSFDPFSLLLTWTMLDFCVLASNLWLAADSPERQRAITSFVMKLMGSFAIMIGVVASGGKGFNFDLGAIPSEVSLFFLLAFILRSWGIIEVFPRRAVGSSLPTTVLINLISLSSAIALLSRIPPMILPRVGTIWILISVILVGLWSAVRVLFATDLFSALPFFISGFGSLQIFCVIENHPAIAFLWGCLAVILGSLLGIFQRFNWFHSIPPSLGLVLAIGIPYTLGGMALSGLIDPFSFHSVFMLLILLGLMIGIARIVWQTDRIQIEIDQSISFVYTVGLLVLFLSALILGMKFQGFYDSNPNIVISGILLVGGILLGGIYYRVRETFHPKEKPNRIIRMAGQLQKIGKSKVPNKLLSAVTQVMDLLVKLISNILEGEGGLLWTLVLLAVMISVISSRGS